MLKNLSSPIFFLAFCWLSSPLNAQVLPDSSLVLIETADENEYIGTIVQQDSETLQLKTINIGTITIYKSSIVSLRPVKSTELKAGEYYYDNVYASTQYFFNSSGYGLPAGEGYYQNAWIWFNAFNLGITDNFSMGIGTIPLFLLGVGSDGIPTPIWFTPKITVPVQEDKINVGASMVFVTALGEDVDGGFGFLNGIATFGSKERNFSVGLGWGYATGEGIANTPTVSLSYYNRGKKKWAFLTENYFINAGGETVALLSAGARHIGKKISIDMAGITFLDLTGGQDSFPLIPWLSLAIPISLN